jgi:TonB family protein
MTRVPAIAARQLLRRIPCEHDDRSLPRRATRTSIGSLALALASIACRPQESAPMQPPAQSRPYRHDQLTTEVFFCVDTGGKTRNIEVVRPSGDANLDRSIVQEVETWRYKPSPPGRMTCSTVRFDLEPDAAKKGAPP